MTNFTGNIGSDKTHAYVQVGTDSYETLGGHCSGARVSGTFELIILPAEIRLLHELDERTGIDVFDL